MSRVVLLAAASRASEPLVADALARARSQFPEAHLDVVLLGVRPVAPDADLQMNYWSVHTRLLAVPPAKGLANTLRRVLTINLNSRRRARAAVSNKKIRELARTADVIVSLSTPTDRAALRLGARSAIPLVAGLNAALAARRRGEW